MRLCYAMAENVFAYAITTSAWNRHKTISLHKNAALLRNGWERFNIKTFANRQKTAYRRVGFYRLVLCYNMIILLKKRFVYWHSDKSSTLKYAEIGRNKRLQSGKEKFWNENLFWEIWEKCWNENFSVKISRCVLKWEFFEKLPPVCICKRAAFL